MIVARRKRESLYWKSVINEIERTARKKTKQERIKKYNFYPLLPKRLHQRVAQIIPLEYSDELVDPTAQQKAESVDSSEEEFAVKKAEVYNESTCSLIERKEKEYPIFDLNLENSMQKQAVKKRRENWYTSYICNGKKDRIKWKSKIYRMEKDIWEKPLDEQAEQLMDASAERFAEWINTLGSKSEKETTTDQLKSLFSIEGNSKLLASIQTDPKEVKAIAKTVADRWNLPEMAMELKYENYINSHLKTAPQETETVAFGKTIPYKKRPWLRSKEDVTIETIFPNVLRSGEHLFKGIAHLRSTKALIEHCKKKPNIRRPTYLVDNGYFKAASQSVSETDVPLYELLKIK